MIYLNRKWEKPCTCHRGVNLGGVMLASPGWGGVNDPRGWGGGTALGYALHQVIW